MKTIFKYTLLVLIVVSCKSKKEQSINLSETTENDLVIAFGSCNRQSFENKLWKPVLENNPIAWIWGGDIIYSDTDDMELMSQHYKQQLEQEGYGEIVKNMKVLGTWDDHDYGLNDGGAEYVAKAESQQLFLDFMGVSKTDSRREREGVYHSEIIETNKGSVNVIILDTRYFRSALTPSENPEMRYQPNVYGEGTMLGNAQWQWLEGELNSSTTDFNLIVSSIQFLSAEHGFETWGTMPHEVDKLKNMISASKAKGVIILSGDRHISEFSKTTIDGVDYPLIDFTSSGMTHSYSSFDGEPNQYREGEVVSDLSFGLLKINFETKKIIMQMRGENNVLQQELIQAY
ncbi:alkaline phosphatase family protein [Flavobacteriaceae bacterium S0825]|uniref:alkaline phosphatase D family protein n=1 Tax=Gaetbulibacter sp. S0825 TaxID=2720084 RepID=UPI001431C0DA|nr:alkaline phosphatase D family protein [Gaetbulibacter sp. S0825]MCK0110103.1 alkaline phosphatase family protein [Flavobacteriaceae bacterium S0825]NIX65732.1 alkaline phosphatase family protein [Gaetbulibacter sp. S0825]